MWESCVAACHVYLAFPGTLNRSCNPPHFSADYCLDLSRGLLGETPPVELMSFVVSVSILILHSYQGQSVRVLGLERFSEGGLGNYNQPRVQRTHRKLL